MSPPSPNVTPPPGAGSSDCGRASNLFPLVYDELRRAAAEYFRYQPAGHTLQPTAVVHEVYLRLINQQNLTWNDRDHFVALAKMAMRQILVNHANNKGAKKRQGRWHRVPLHETAGLLHHGCVDSIALHEALNELKVRHRRKAQVVELHFFGGLGFKETAQALGVSQSTVEGDWRFARAFLSRALSGET